MDSILTSIKKLLGIDEAYTAFDMDIIMYINSAFATLTQIGIGPSKGFSIEDDMAVWTDFVDDARLEQVKTFVKMKVQLAFDPPQSSAHIKVIEDMLDETTYRLYTLAGNY